MQLGSFLFMKERTLPGFKDPNIFLHAMYCSGATYLLRKAFASNSGAVSNFGHGLLNTRATSFIGTPDTNGSG